MRLPAILYLVGMGLVLIGERLIGGDDNVRWGLDGGGALALILCLVLLISKRSNAPKDQKGPHTTALMYAAVGIAALGLYAATTDTALTALDFSEEGEKRYSVAMTCAWMITWLVGTLPFLAADRSIAACPVVVTPGRTRDATLAALATALAISIVPPINYLGVQHNKRWDVGYFRTAEPGSSTMSVVENLSEPIRVVAFFPTSSDVIQEVRTYFDHIAGDNLVVEYVDHALEPELAKELKIKENGNIALVRGDGDDQQVETIKVGADFESAKRNLKKLDEKVQQSLVKLTRGKRTAYVTVGHGELYWKAGDPKERMIDTFKKALTGLQYKVKELGVAQGLANEVPEDADLVLVLGPNKPFLPEELTALDAYRKRGGALLVTLGADTPDMGTVLTPMGVSYNDVPLISDKNIAVITYRKTDRFNLGTNKFSTHDSVTTLSRNAKSLGLLVPRSGYLEEIPNSGAKVTTTVRSMPDSWDDTTKNLEFDAATEKRDSRALVMAVTGPAPDGKVDPNAPAPAPDPKAKDAAPTGPEYRAVVVSSSDWASDLFLPAVQGNAVFLLDTISWLVKDPSLAGTVNSEDDVKIQHSKEGQGWIFYGTSFLIPLLLLSSGLLRVTMRRKRGAA